MKLQTVELYFQDEVRGIGCGLRTISVEVGRTLAYVHWHGRRKVISRERYEGILAATEAWRARALSGKPVTSVRRTVTREA